MWAEVKWVVENFGNILLITLCLLMFIGGLLELVVRLIPTDSPDSFTTLLGLKLGRFGTKLVTVGVWIKGLLDLIKFPNKIKK
jgi:hypothetical protein